MKKIALLMAIAVMLTVGAFAFNSGSQSADYTPPLPSSTTY